MTDTSQETGAESETGTEEGTESEVVTLKKEEHAKLNETIGSLKRELKDLKKARTEETSQTKTDDSALLQRFERLSLTQAGINHKDDIELARATAKKWGMPIEDVLGDDDFKVKLGRQQTLRQNLEATTEIKGGGTSKGVQDTPEYWLAKGNTEGLEKVTDSKKRAAILRAFVQQKTGKTAKFYNSPK